MITKNYWNKLGISQNIILKVSFKKWKFITCVWYYKYDFLKVIQNKCHDKNQHTYK